MSKLFCDAVNCANNHERLCCLVDAENRSLSAFADVQAEAETMIGCSAGACAYNAGGLCDARRVQIDGSYAHRTDATSCATFRK